MYLTSKRVFRKGHFNTNNSIYNRLIFAAKVYKCVRALASPDCCKRVILRAFPLVNGCNFVTRSTRDTGPCLATCVIHRGYGGPSGFEYNRALSGCLGSGGVPKVCSISAHRVAGVVERDNIVGTVVYSSPEGFSGRGIRECEMDKTIRTIATGAPLPITYRGPGCGIILLSCNGGRGVIHRLIGHNYGITIIPDNAGTSSILGLGPSNVVLSGKPKSPDSGTSYVGRLGGLVKGGPVFKVYLKRRLLTLTVNTGAAGLGCNREKMGRPIGYVRANEACVSSRGRNCTILGSRVRGYNNVVDCVGTGSNAGRNTSCPGGGTFSIRFRPRTYDNPRSAEFLFGGFVGVVKNGRWYLLAGMWGEYLLSSQTLLLSTEQQGLAVRTREHTTFLGAEI